MTASVIGIDDGLRARKRAALAANIEQAAMELSIEHGYENVTVDMICAATMVSPRTFFNYFGSKEGVVLGAAAPEPSDDDREAFLSATGTDVLTDLVTLLTTALTERDPDPAVYRWRRELISERPELLNRQIGRIAEQESKLVTLVLERFRRQGRTVESTPDLADEARMVVALVGSVLRFTARAFFDEDTDATPRELLARSVVLIRRITRGE